MGNNEMKEEGDLTTVANHPKMDLSNYNMGNNDMKEEGDLPTTANHPKMDLSNYNMGSNESREAPYMDLSNMGKPPNWSIVNFASHTQHAQCIECFLKARRDGSLV